MIEKVPFGAITEEERHDILCNLSSLACSRNYVWHGVNTNTGEIITCRPGEARQFSFTWRNGPYGGAYFKNYWHAYAYSLKVKRRG